MTLDEKLAILEVIKPTEEEVRFYFDRLYANTPLPLLYVEPDGKSVAKSVLPKKVDYLTGIFINENTIVYLKSLTKDDLGSLCNGGSIDYITEEDVATWVKKNFTALPNPRAATEDDIKILEKNHICKNFSTTLETLRYHGIKTPKPSGGWIEKGFSYVEFYDGKALIRSYLDASDLLVFADYEPAINSQFFQSAEQ